MEESDKELQLGILAATLRLNEKSSTDFINYLAALFLESLPNRTAVQREGLFPSERSPVRELIIKLDQYHYQFLKHINESVNVKELKVIRGVVIKTSEISIEQSLNRILEQLSEMAKKSTDAEQAFEKLLRG